MLWEGFKGQIRLSLLAFFLMVTFWAERQKGRRAERIMDKYFMVDLDSLTTEMSA